MAKGRDTARQRKAAGIRKAEVLQAHQDVLHALVQLDLLLASEAPDDDPYREQDAVDAGQQLHPACRRSGKLNGLGAVR